jgi:hypothetical protein
MKSLFFSHATLPVCVALLDQPPREIVMGVLFLSAALSRKEQISAEVCQLPT